MAQTANITVVTPQSSDQKSSIQQPQQKMLINQNDDQKQAPIKLQTYPTLDESPTFDKNERSNLENSLYKYFENNKLLNDESTINNVLLNKIITVFNNDFKQIDDIHKYIYNNKNDSPLFQSPTNHNHLKLISKIPHNAKEWKKLHLLFKNSYQWDTRARLWNLIQHQTVHLITNIFKLPSSIRNELDNCIGYSDINQAGTVVRNPVPPYINKMEIGTVNMDCIVTAIKLKKQGFNPVVLNLANQKAPAAATHVKSEGGTQEENLFKRSTLYLSLWQHKNNQIAHVPAYGYDDIWLNDDNINFCKESYYPMDEFHGGIYSKNVYVFRGSEQSGYAMLPLKQRCVLSFISVAANKHYCFNSSMINLSTDEIKAYIHKIRTIFQIAYDQGHDTIVLGALGCGIFNNPPEQVAKLFRSVLYNEFNGYFARIVFAILWDHNSKHKLVQSFQKYFPDNKKIFNSL